MAEETVKYKVETEYSVRDNHASSSLHEIGHAAHEAHEHTEGLRDTLKEVAEAFLLEKAVETAKEMFIGLNAQVERTRNILGAVVGANYAIPFKEASEAAGEMFERFEEAEQTFPADASEFARMGSTIAASFSQAGASINELTEIAEDGTKAAKALGESTESAAMQMNRMMTGQVSRRNAFAQTLLHATGMSEAEWKSATSEERLKKMRAALGSDNMKQFETQYTQSYEGQVTLLKNKIEDLGKKIGLPLFHAVTTELQSWNTWADKNKDKIEDFAHKFAQGLVQGFEYIKEIGAFIVDHKDVLIKIGEVWAAAKIGQSLGNVAGAIGGRVQGLFQSIGQANAAGSGGKMGFGQAGQAFGVGYAIGTFINEQTGASHKLAEGFALLTGRTNEYAIQNEKIVDAMNNLQEATDKAAKELSKIHGAGGTYTHAANVAVQEDYRRLAGTLHRYAMGEHGALDQAELSSTFYRGFTPMSGKKPINPAGGYDFLAAMGAGAYEQRAADLESKQNSYVAGANMLFSAAMGQMTEEQRKSVDVQKSTEAILLEMMRTNGGTIADAMKFIVTREGENIMDKQAKINQTVNININQVTAKDPGRWLAELDDYAGKRVRARTRPKSAPARGL